MYIDVGIEASACAHSADTITSHELHVLLTPCQPKTPPPKHVTNLHRVKLNFIQSHIYLLCLYLIL